MTSLATCSSAASIPANLQATKDMRVSESIYETVVPLGAILHKDGSVFGGIIKVAFLFGIFHMSFSGALVLLIALMIGILVGTVMGAIPKRRYDCRSVNFVFVWFPATSFNYDRSNHSTHRSTCNNAKCEWQQCVQHDGCAVSRRKKLVS